jgi:hypothetical protein
MNNITLHADRQISANAWILPRLLMASMVGVMAFLSVAMFAG